jgi:hypothetical protein
MRMTSRSSLLGHVFQLHGPAFPWHGPAWCPTVARRPACGPLRHTLFARTKATELCSPSRCSCLDTTRWWSAQAATCGRWVTARPGGRAPVLHQSAHGFGHRPSDAGIHLIKDQRLRRSPVRWWSRQWPAQCATVRRLRPPCPRSRRAARMAGHQKRDLFQTALRGPGKAVFPGLLQNGRLACQDLAWPG